VFRQVVLLSGLLLPLSGCAWAVRDATDRSVSGLVAQPFDIAPEAAKSAPEAANRDSAPSPPAAALPRDSTSSSSRSGEPTASGPGRSRILLASAASRPSSDDATAPETGQSVMPSAPGTSVATPVKKAALVTDVPTDVQTSAMMESRRDAARPGVPLKDDNVLAAAWTQPAPGDTAAGQRKLDLEISPRLPGSEAPRIVLPRDSAAKEREIERLFPELPSLPVEPKPQPGPGGKPYTLADLQRLATANSPALRQAASNVKAAQGNLIQAGTYPNPVVSYINWPSANENTGSLTGGMVDQPIITGGKMKLGVAAAQKDLDNTVLALKRARMDLATSVRKAYFTLLVDVETLVVTRALAQFSDEIYRLQVELLKGTQVAPYEPTALRAQTFANRLAYKQAIASYIYDWKALVATLGMPQLPLSEIAGQVDRLIPYYEYDEVLAYVLQHHTDVLTARNVVKKAQYNLKVAQVTPLFPNFDLNMTLLKDFGNGPFGTLQTVNLSMPIPTWNQNKGNIIAAQGALIRASKESHRVEVTLTDNLALTYENYRNNLYAMEYYRRNVLPDLVRYYRGIFARRQIDPTSAFGDLVFAQQNLSTNVSTYLSTLQSLWMSVVSVADFLQTDDLYQMAKGYDLPKLPDLHQLQYAPWARGNESLAGSNAKDSWVSRAVFSAAAEATPRPQNVGGVPSKGGTDAWPPPLPVGAGGASPRTYPVTRPAQPGAGADSPPPLGLLPGS
jgi:cobalt-zinc-cadmium efflux system outer membrane protein